MRNTIFLLATLLSIISCSSDNSRTKGNDDTSDFDRSAMLTHWADDIIIPAYANLNETNTDMYNQIQNFVSNPSLSTLQSARNSHRKAYISWQKANIWAGIGPGLNENLRDFFNIYPANEEGIKQLAEESNYKLNLLSNASKQGYPALDFLLNGFGKDDNEIISKFSTNNKYGNFTLAIANKLKEKTTKVYNEWKSYKTTFVKNHESSASGSIDLVANDFLLYYEKYYRNGKVRFPSGTQTGTPEPKIVEAYYSPDLSIELLNTSTKAMQDFFQGKSYNSNTSGLGFEAYLKALKREDISNDINNNFKEILNAIQAIKEPMKDAVVNNRDAILSLHDKIQKNVVPLKVDMLQKLNISVSYFDGDGD